MGNAFKNHLAKSQKPVLMPHLRDLKLDATSRFHSLHTVPNPTQPSAPDNIPNLSYFFSPIPTEIQNCESAHSIEERKEEVKKRRNSYLTMAPPPASVINLRTPPEPGKKSAARTYIIYFITGNPGLIEYYRTFLTHLYGLLSRDTASNRDVEFQVYGRSLSGFEMKTADIKTMKWRKQPPYGLQDQIRHAEDELTELVEEVKDQGAKDVRVILVGHSVGSYIALEVIRRLRAHGLAGEDFETRITGAVGLFPTVVDIARSETGLKVSVRLLFHPNHFHLSPQAQQKSHRTKLIT